MLKRVRPTNSYLTYYFECHREEFIENYTSRFRVHSAAELEDSILHYGADCLNTEFGIEEPIDINEMLDCYSDPLIVGTKAGLIKAFKITDPAAPGIVVVLQPKGTRFEINLACAEVKEDPDIRHEGEKEDDVSVYLYGSTHSEDYTDKAVIQHDEIIKLLEDSTKSDE
jgi:hypothetical protein